MMAIIFLVLPLNKLVEDEEMPNHEDIKNEIIFDDDDSLALDIYPLQKTFWKLEEWKIKMKEDKFKEWTMKYYLLSKK